MFGWYTKIISYLPKCHNYKDIQKESQKMKTKKHLLKLIVSYVIAIALVLGMIPIVPTTMTVRADDKLAGEGTLSSPYLISSKTDWDTFANADNKDLYWGSGVYVKLTADIGSTDDPITTTVGTVSGDEQGIAFAGTFDGGGHTINVNINNTSDQGTALFRYISGATIKNVKVTGTVNGTMYCAS